MISCRPSFSNAGPTFLYTTFIMVHYFFLTYTFKPSCKTMFIITRYVYFSNSLWLVAEQVNKLVKMLLKKKHISMLLPSYMDCCILSTFDCAKSRLMHNKLNIFLFWNALQSMTLTYCTACQTCAYYDTLQYDNELPNAFMDKCYVDVYGP